MLLLLLLEGEPPVDSLLASVSLLLFESLGEVGGLVVWVMVLGDVVGCNTVVEPLLFMLQLIVNCPIPTLVVKDEQDRELWSSNNVSQSSAVCMRCTLLSQEPSPECGQSSKPKKHIDQELKESFLARRLGEGGAWCVASVEVAATGFTLGCWSRNRKPYSLVFYCGLQKAQVKNRTHDRKDGHLVLD